MLFAKNPTLNNFYNIKTILTDENNASKQIGYSEWEFKYFSDLLRNAWILAFIIVPIVYILQRPDAITSSVAWILGLISIFIFPVYLAFPFVFVFCNVVALANLLLKNENQRKRWQKSLILAGLFEIILLIGIAIYIRN